MLWGRLQVIFSLFLLASLLPSHLPLVQLSRSPSFSQINPKKKKLTAKALAMQLNSGPMALVRLFVYKICMKGMLTSIDLVCDLYEDQK